MLDSARHYELVVRPRGRSPADEYYHNGTIWIEGREGNNYTIDIRNNTYTRALFIISVDGLDVLNGQPAGPASQGYIVNPMDTVSIPGWKLNNNEAAEFYFSRSRDSYVNSIGGSTSNTGVIGAMVFSEHVAPTTYQLSHISNSVSSRPIYNGAVTYDSWSPGRGMSGGSLSAQVKSAAASASMLSVNAITSSPVTQEVGTGFGNTTQWQTTAISFQRASPDRPDAILALYYNTARNLEKMGIKLRKKRDVSYKADPFPAYSDGCKPPDGWNG